MGNLLDPGQVLLDRYLVESYLNEGGMQQVFAAKDQSFNRHVALKVPKNDSAERRFDRSAHLSARITHPNVAKTLDYFEEGGKSYLVEELIDGIDLGRYLEKCDPLDPHLAAHILHHLARALAASHHANVIHRDLKPSNIIVGNDLAASVVKVTDFGIAKMAEEEITSAVDGGNEDSITASKTAMGALPYMAPEMIEDSKHATVAVDVWAWGALAYRLLSGEPPYGSGLKAVTGIIAAKTPPKPTIWQKNSHFEPLLTELWNIIVSSLNKDPKQRPTANQLAEKCDKLGYIYGPRASGMIETFPVRNWSYGFILGDNKHKVFFHRQSFFGVSDPTVGMKVAYSTFPGSPHVRAFPVVPLN
jgi:serine/threonine-protein kinase